MDKIRCPNCGSTAQVKNLSDMIYLCGCGQVFYVSLPQEITLDKEDKK